VTVESTLGRGTTVHVNLPACAEAEVQESAAVVERRAAGSERILVLDDDAATRSIVVSMLESLGYRAEAVNNGTAAIQRYRRALLKGRPFDAVILDLVVPEGMGGKETMERLGEIDENVTAILASGYAHGSMTAEFERFGFRAIIPKPYTRDELSRTLQSVIGKSVIGTHSARVH
jgi:CheY-like chemotaxis protein